MRVMVIVKASKASEAGRMPDQKILEEMGRFNDELVKASVMRAGEGLHPSARGKHVRVAGSKCCDASTSVQSVSAKRRRRQSRWCVKTRLPHAGLRANGGTLGHTGADGFARKRAGARLALRQIASALPQRAPVLDCLGHMLGLQVLVGGQIRHGARDLEHAVIGAGRPAQPHAGCMQ